MTEGEKTHSNSNGPVNNMEVEALSSPKGMEPQKERQARLLKQLGLVIVAALGHFSLGSTYTWPSPALSSLALNNGTLIGTQISLSSTQKDMTGSLVSLGILFGTWISGWLVGRWGRLLVIRGVVAIFLLGWIMLALSPSATLLILSRFVLGVACGAVSLAGTLYISELSDVDVRGQMMSFTTIGIVTGGLYTVALGYPLPWHYLALVCALPPLVLLVLSVILPPSPSFLLVCGNKARSVEVLKRLRGPYADVAAEVNKLETSNVKSSGGWRSLLEVQILKRVAVVVMLFFFQNFCGNYVFLVHTSRILEAAGAALDPDLATVIVGVIRVLGTIISIFLVDKIGRRPCLVSSHAINTASMLVLGTFVYLADAAPPEDETYAELSWVPLVCVLILMLALNVGAHPIPYILTAEYFPTNIRGQASAACLTCSTVFSFASLQLYSVMQESLTQAGLYWFYGSVSAVAVLFTLVCVQETKGKHIG